mmetsp:Transcript_17861/g.30319  ORF Transcript_17861/g.30319 Transcript_17861/m.30319 type:complete len:274 (-) Transcript_17861:304-1125(-)
MPEKKQSAFKQLYIDMFKKGGDFSKLADSIPKKKITCYVKESYPYFLIADDFFYVPCYFTQKAVEDFRAKNPSVKIVDLKLRVIELSSWTLEMVKVNSSDVFTSYGGLELRIIVKEFNLNQKQGVQRVKPEDLARYPVNIYRDDEVKTLILSYTHQCLTQAVAKGLKGETLPDVSKFGAKGNVKELGVLKFAQGEAFNQYQFKEGKTPVVEMEQIHKLEKGSVKRGLSSQAKAKVVGGKVVKGSKKSAGSRGVGNIATKISKHSVAIGKKSHV